VKVLLAPSSYLPALGGLQVNTHALAKALKRKGIEVRVLTRGKGAFRSYYVEDIRVHSVPFYVFRGTVRSAVAFIVRGMISIIRGFVLLVKIRPQLVNVHFLGANAFYIYLLRKILPFRFGLVVTLHGTNEAPNEHLADSEGNWEAKILNFTAKKILRDAEAVVAVSQHLFDKVTRFFPDLHSKTSVIPVGVEFERFANVTPEEGDYILGLGRLSFEKGFDILIRAFQHLSSHFPKLKLVVAGDGSEKESLIGLAESLGVRDRIKFCGEVSRERAIELLSKCRALAVPSRIEGFGVVILEALALGKLVVATSVGGIPEIIRDGETGFLVPPENPEKLSEKLGFVLSNEKLASDIGSRASKAMKGTYDWDAIAGKYLAVYTAVCDSALQ